MKRVLCLVFALSLFLTACGNKKQTIEITLPANSAQSVVFYEKVFTANRKTLTVSCSGIEQAEVLLAPENDLLTGFITQTITSTKAEKVTAQKGEQFKIGIVSQNTTDSDIVVTLNISNIEFE